MLKCMIQTGNIAAIAGRSYGGPSEKFVGGLWREFSQVAPQLLRSCLYVEITRRNAFWGNFLEVCFKTPPELLRSPP